MANPKGKRKDPAVCSLGLGGNRELSHAWICYMQVYKEGETIGIQGMGTVQKGRYSKCRCGRTRRVHSAAQHPQLDSSADLAGLSHTAWAAG